MITQLLKLSPKVGAIALIALTTSLSAVFAQCAGHTGDANNTIYFCEGSNCGGWGSNWGTTMQATCHTYCCPGDGDKGQHTFDNCGTHVAATGGQAGCCALDTHPTPWNTIATACATTATTD